MNKIIVFVLSGTFFVSFGFAPAPVRANHSDVHTIQQLQSQLASLQQALWNLLAAATPAQPAKGPGTTTTPAVPEKKTVPITPTFPVSTPPTATQPAQPATPAQPYIGTGQPAIPAQQATPAQPSQSTAPTTSAPQSGTQPETIEQPSQQPQQGTKEVIQNLQTQVSDVRGQLVQKLQDRIQSLQAQVEKLKEKITTPTPTVPSIKSTGTGSCPTVPYYTIAGAITSLSGVTANISLYPSDIAGFSKSLIGNYVNLQTLFKTNSGVLLAAGRDHVSVTTLDVPVIYRSADQGKTWSIASVSNPGKQPQFIGHITEDANGVLWAAGMPGVLKSIDGGMRWTWVNISFTPNTGQYTPAKTKNDYVQDIFVANDNSVIIAVPFYVYADNVFYPNLYAYTNIYRTTDGGATWKVLFTRNQWDISSIVGAGDGAIVFTGTSDDGNSNSIFRFTEGTLTPVFNFDVSSGGFQQLFKTKNGAIYLVSEENTKKSANQGFAENAIYSSRDHGVTWRKAGVLPLGSMISQGADYFAEGSDGSLYLAAFTDCWATTIYQSQNEGKKWEAISGNIPEISESQGPLPAAVIEEIGGNVLLGGGGGVIFSTSPSSAGFKFTRTLQRGLSGEDVRTLQEFLAQDKDIYPQGLATGYFGPATEAAVKKFQEKHGIEQVGVVGPKTRAKIQDLASCSTSDQRPCYERVTRGKTIRLNQVSGENAFSACMNSASESQRGESAQTTAISQKEIYQYCHEGRSEVVVKKFEGVSVAEAVACPVLPLVTFVSGVESGWENPDSSILLRTIFKSQRGPLYIGGYQRGQGKIYKSMDNGKTWTAALLPSIAAQYGTYPYPYYLSFVRRIIEDKSGALYAAGSFLWKSTDGGATWSIISQQIADIAVGESVEDVLISRDGSLLALARTSQPYGSGYNEVHKSADGGKTWQLLFGPLFQSYGGYNFIEANDGSLVFNTGTGDIYAYDAIGVLKKTWSASSAGFDSNIHFLKAKDGAIYFVSGDSAKSSHENELMSYQSMDNGQTWIKGGSLPHSGYMANDAPIEASDGSLWAATNLSCGTRVDRQTFVYRSTDKGATWTAFAGSPVSEYANFIEHGSVQGPFIMDIAESEGKIFTVSFEVGAMFEVPVNLLGKATPVQIFSPNGGESFVQGTPIVIKSTTVPTYQGYTPDGEVILKGGVDLGITDENAVQGADPRTHILGWLHFGSDGSVSWAGNSICKADVEKERIMETGTARLKESFGGECSSVLPGRYKAIALAENEFGKRVLWDDATGKPGNWDLSDAPFTILPPPSITVVSPNGGETYKQGDSVTIKWNTNLITDKAVSINLEHLGGIFAGTIVEKLPQATEGGTFTYTWIIPSTLNPASDYKIRISDTHGVGDYSDQPFAVTSTSVALTCPVNLDFQWVGSFETGWDPATWSTTNYSASIANMIKTKNGILVAGGSKPIKDSFGTVTGWAPPAIYRSLDNGKTWNEIVIPNTQSSDAIKTLTEDQNGILFAGGTKFWKSTDGGATWMTLTNPLSSFSTLTSARIHDLFVARDNSLVATLVTSYSSISDYPSEIRKSIDGGVSWQKLYTHPRTIISITETNDNALVFMDIRDENNSTGAYRGVYRFINGTSTKTFSAWTYYTYLGSERTFAKTNDGTLFTIVKIPEDTYTSGTVPSGSTHLVAYISTDNGITWTRGGVLPNSYQNPRHLGNVLDGSMYAVAYKTCSGGDTLYRSTDKGVTWIATADSNLPNYIWGGFVNQLHPFVEIGGVVLSVARGGIFSNGLVPTATISPSPTSSPSPTPSSFVISTQTLPAGAWGIPYYNVSSNGSLGSVILGVTGGVAPYTWEIGGGNFPKGLTLNTTTGLISQWPLVVPGTYAFTVNVIDSRGARATKELSIEVKSDQGGYWGGNQYDSHRFVRSVRFGYDRTKLTDVKSIRLYEKKPGQTQFTVSGVFPLAGTVCGTSVTSDPNWTLGFSCRTDYEAWTAQSRAYDSGDTVPIGEYSYYVAVVDSAEVETTISDILHHYALSSTKILSPTLTQSPVSQPFTIQWTVPSSGWPSHWSSTITAAYSIHVHEEVSKTQIYRATVSVPISSQTGSKAYDGLPLDPTKIYRVNAYYSYLGIDYANRARVNYITITETPTTFSVNP